MAIVYADIDDKLKKRFLIRIAKNGGTMKEAVESAIRLWLEQKEGGK